MALREAVVVATLGAELLAVAVARQPKCTVLQRDFSTITAQVWQKVGLRTPY
jgi:hypothetical protein